MSSDQKSLRSSSFSAKLFFASGFLAGAEDLSRQESFGGAAATSEAASRAKLKGDGDPKKAVAHKS